MGTPRSHGIEVIDVRLGPLNASQDENDPLGIKQAVISSLSSPSNHKSLPGILLYDERGLKLFNESTIPDPGNEFACWEELEILKNHDERIAQVINKRGGPMNIVELGSGALRSTSRILLSLARLSGNNTENGVPITYYALDLVKNELSSSLSSLHANCGEEMKGKVLTKGMWGTFEGGIKYIKNGGLAGYTPSSPSPLHIFFFGNTFGNFPRSDAASFLRSLPLRPGSADTLFLGLESLNDGHGEEDMAYDDPEGCVRRFYMNALRSAGRVLGDESVFGYDWDANSGPWKYYDRYDERKGKLEVFMKSTKRQTIRIPGLNTKVGIEQGELVKVFESNKYSDAEMKALFASASLRVIQRWTESKNKYCLWLLERPPLPHSE